ncbi:hypothetical protein V6N13_014495 [Hibiscus sabdariffa]|uniref:F-box domain-containing protein n=1 Tax=Hibiscus sabdariffa TaxID=183260 RepID=A0ABR2RVG5_9ROSI
MELPNSKMVGYEYRRMKVGDMERGICKFVGRVNDVLIAHQGSTIDGLRVRCYSDNGSWRYVIMFEVLKFLHQILFRFNIMKISNELLSPSSAVKLSSSISDFEVKFGASITSKLDRFCLGAVAINGGSLRSTSTGQQRACGSNDANVNVRSALTDQQHTCGSNAENYNVRSLSTGLQNGDVRGAGDLQLFADAKKNKQLKHDEKDTRDRISELSDDVLVKILSFLPSEEAVLKTSFLSRRWKQLWESLPVSFNFDGPMPVRRRMMDEDWKREICKFVGWVNHVLIAHQGSTIDELRVHFYLDKGSWGYVDKWIEIAMKKKVKKLELDFLDFPRFQFAYYPFPQNCFCRSEFLTSLCLKHVGIQDFPTCTNLRHLSCKVEIQPGERLFTLRFLIEASPFLHKFTLEITNCNEIKNKLRKVRKVVECSPHKHLKELEIIGFLGQPMEAKFVAYLLKSSIKLEKIVIHTGFLYLLTLKMLYSKEFAEITHQMAHESARQLMEHRPEAELVLL